MPLALRAVRSPAYPMMPYSDSSARMPARPSSSPMTARMKSVWASGT